MDNSNKKQVILINNQNETNNENIDTINNNEPKKINVSGGKVYSFLKRAFDIILSSLFLIIFGWFILLLMLIKYFEDCRIISCKIIIAPGTEKTKKRYRQFSKDGKMWEVKVVPDKNATKKDKTVHGAIYTSLRVGKDGKIIKFHKIRSMCKGAEKMKDELLKYEINEADYPVFKLKYDPRITKFGRFLRKFSLDELPQIFDILVGSISIVGPRSPIPSEVEHYNNYQKNRLKVKGGLLCLWQISHNRNKLSFDEWVELDIKYIENRSLWLDFKIIIKGLLMVLFDRSGE